MHGRRSAGAHNCGRLLCQPCPLIACVFDPASALLPLLILYHLVPIAVIWDALHAACEADQATARTILESAGVIVAAPDMSVCYDVQGWK